MPQVHPWKTLMQKRSSLINILSGCGTSCNSTSVKPLRWWWVQAEVDHRDCLLKYPCWMLKILFQQKSKFSVSRLRRLSAWVTKLGLKWKRNTVRTDWMYSCLLRLHNQRLKTGEKKWPQSSEHRPTNLKRRVCLRSHEMTSPHVQRTCLLRCTSAKHLSDMFFSIVPWTTPGCVELLPAQSYSLKLQLQLPPSRPRWAKSFPFSLHYWFIYLFVYLITLMTSYFIINENCSNSCQYMALESWL